MLCNFFAKPSAKKINLQPVFCAIKNAILSNFHYFAKFPIVATEVLSKKKYLVPNNENKIFCPNFSSFSGDCKIFSLKFQTIAHDCRQIFFFKPDFEFLNSFQEFLTLEVEWNMRSTLRYKDFSVYSRAKSRTMDQLEL